MLTKIQDLIKKGESECLEFKTSFGKETMETLSAFANSKGGVVLIGLNDRR
jgi:ATP-dependent DNA helicase RecG